MEKVKLILGTMTFGESVFNPQAGEFINAFLDAGYEELDTAYVYNDGTCERLLGEVLPGLGRPYKIATKVNPRISGRLDGDAAYKQVNESLERMNLPSVDTVYLHFPDPKTPVESVLEAMADLHSQGKFKELGLSNFPAWMVTDVWHICDSRGWVKPTVFQGIYNPLTRKAETELNACLNHLKKSFFEAVDLIRKAGEKYGINTIEATYRWLAFHSMLDGNRGDAILIGASKLGHLQQNMDTLKAGPLPEEMVQAFEQAWAVTKADSPEYFTLYTGQVPAPPIKTK